MLFLSDNVIEIDAAVAAGMKAFVVDRLGNAPLSKLDKDRLSIVSSVDQINLAPIAANGKDGSASMARHQESEPVKEEQ